MRRKTAAAARAWWLRRLLGPEAIGKRIAIGRDASIVARDRGELRIGDDTSVEQGVRLAVRRGKLHIGARAFLGQGTTIVARERILIGQDVLIAEYVTIRDQDHDVRGPLPTARNGFVTAPITIGNNVWLGAKVTVLRGVTIGDNTVVGANAVVTRDLPANVVAAGVPARVIRQIDRLTPTP